MLEVSDLKCVRGERLLFAHVGFRLESGKLLEVRGANGAGKTSLLRILCGLSLADAGQVSWHGRAIAELDEAYRQDLFYLGHHNALQDALTAHENLVFYAALSGVLASAQDIARALAHMGLRGCQNRLIRHLSQGQKRRVALSRLLLSRAKLWVLDEPFVALDAVAIAWLVDVLASHLQAGGLAVLTSHQPVTIHGALPQVLELGA